MNIMITEVNKIIAGELLAHRSVVIPGVGTLCVVHRTARRLSRRQIAAPRNEIEFRSGEIGTSLVELIRRAAACDEGEAQAIFARWLAKTRDGDVLTLEGIGVLRHRSFTADPTFAGRLNPLGNEVVTLRLRMNRSVVATAVVAILIAVGVFAYMQFGSGYDPRPGRRTAVGRPNAASVANTEQKSGSSVKDAGANETQQSGSAAYAGDDGQVGKEPSKTTAVKENEPAQSIPATTDKTTSSAISESSANQHVVSDAPVRTAAEMATAPDRMQSGWSYVVYGVFSTEANAARCRDELLQKNPSMAVAVYRFGAKYMVTPCASQDRSVCERFAREHREQWPDLWIYSKK